MRRPTGDALEAVTCDDSVRGRKSPRRIGPQRSQPVKRAQFHAECGPPTRKAQMQHDIGAQLIQGSRQNSLHFSEPNRTGRMRVCNAIESRARRLP